MQARQYDESFRRTVARVLSFLVGRFQNFWDGQRRTVVIVVVDGFCAPADMGRS